MADPSNEPTASTTTSKTVDDLASHFISRIFRRREASVRSRSRAKLPWEPWELDERFFQALSRWTLDHPETSLDRMMDNIRNGLESSRDLMELIPDNPFPARGLVTALAYLFRLGITISRAQRDVYEFARDVISWVGQVKFAFESSEGGRFSLSAWHDLKRMRKLVDEVCFWAVERLNDGRWSRIGHGTRIQGEIQEFSKRISDARALFRDLSAINLAKGLDAIMTDLRRLLHRQSIIVNEIRKIRETQQRQLDEVLDELQGQKLTAERDRFLAEALAGHTVVDPTYDKQGKHPCDPTTRVEVLAEINKWIYDVIPGSSNFLWLTGDPGCGKSAVTASIAKECKKQNVLWAQFFINRNNVETTNPNSYFPSIANQLAYRSSSVADVLQHTLVKDRTLTDGISAEQAAKLFMDSVRCASRLDPKQPVVIVIDGLDETDRTRLEDTATIFSTLFTALEKYGNVKVFISSRTENEIQKSFVLPSNNTHVKRVHLDTAHPASIQDVAQYIKGHLADIVQKHDLNWEIWPGEERCRALGERASGLFIWGVTAVKFIKEQLRTDGEECLDDVLNMLTAEVLHDINSLYRLILKVTHGPNPSEWELERFRRIVGAVVFLQRPLCIDDLAALLDLRKTPASKPVDIPHFVRRFRTILVAGSDPINGKTVPRIHKSVYEFITSTAVDEQFRVDPDHVHLQLGLQCLCHLGAVHEAVNKDTLPMPLRYASRYWSTHLSQVQFMEAKIMCADYRTFPSSSPRSLFDSSMYSVEAPIRVVYSSLKSNIIATSGDYRRTWSAWNGANGSEHSGTVTGIAFSPDGKRIVSCSSNGDIMVCDPRHSFWIRTLISSYHTFRAVAMSHDNQLIVSGSDDNLVRIWDCFTSEQIGEPFQGHTGAAMAVAFSPNGEQIISGAKDRSCILWNVHGGSSIEERWTGHEDAVSSVAFSASGQQACSVDIAGFCIVWSISSRQKHYTWRYDGLNPEWIIFSPYHEDLVAIGGWNGIEIRYKGRQWPIPSSNRVRCLSFSQNSKEIIFGNAFSIFAAGIDTVKHTARVVGRGDYRSNKNFGFAYSAALSPNSDFLAYIDMTTIRVLALQCDKTVIKAASVDNGTLDVLEHDGGGEITNSLAEMKVTQYNHDAAKNSRRLDKIRWYEKDIGIAGSAARLWLVTDDIVIAAYNGGAVSVWKYSGRH